MQCPAPAIVQEAPERLVDDELWGTRQSTVEERVIDQYVIETYLQDEAPADFVQETDDTYSLEETPVEEHFDSQLMQPAQSHLEEQPIQVQTEAELDDRSEASVPTESEPALEPVMQSAPIQPQVETETEAEPEVLISASWNATQNTEALETQYNEVLVDDLGNLEAELINRTFQQPNEGGLPCTDPSAVD